MLRLTFVVLIVVLVAFSLALRQGKTAETIRRLTNTPEQSLNLNPILSDDASVVVFESTSDLADVGGNNTFHAVRSDVSTQSVTFEEIANSRAASASISANGRVIAFASTEDLVNENPDRNSEIYLFDGNHLKQLTHTVPTVESSRLIDGNFEPSISGDGKSIAFSSNRNGGSAIGLEISLYDTTTAETRRITNTSDESSSSKPKIAGTGNYIYFIQSKTSDTSDLMLYDVLSHHLRRVVENVSALALTPGRAVSTDGNRIVYSAQTAPHQTQVFLYDLREDATRQLTQLGTRSSDVDLNPTISGDGKRITFATRRKVTAASDGSVELYLLDLPTGTIEQITNAPSSATGDVISSLNHDGTSVAFNFPRVLSASVSNSDFANNSEIYLATLNPRPQFGQAKIANAATRNTSELRVAPDSIAVISGSFLSTRTEQAKLIDGNLPLAIDGVMVQVNGRQTRLLFVSPSEVIIVVPTGINDGPTEFVVVNSEGFPSKASAIITRAAPGVFGFESQAIALNADTLTAAPFDPSDDQLHLSLFATGVRNATQLSVTIGGEPVVCSPCFPPPFPGLMRFTSLCQLNSEAQAMFRF
jgi:uncharacterized protein (TIGR03437 family)